jgi:glycerol uptake facilitator-like aquaporin
MPLPEFNLKRRLFAEALGTALLVTVVIGSGIMGERLAGGNAAIALLGNTIATGAILVVLILVFGSISGAHFNPVVSLSFAVQRQLKWTECLWYSAVQIMGGIAGAILAHIMFGMPLIQISVHTRTGIGIWTGEFVASFGLLMTIIGCLRNRPDAVPYAVGLFITAGYWFTSSTSFANPAVTIARSLTDTFSGIRQEDVLGFIFAQILGSLAATAAFHWFTRPDDRKGKRK